MAKKNLSALMSGIMGQPEQVDSLTEPLPSPSYNSVYEESKVGKPEGRKRGRPKKDNKGERSTFIVDPEIMKKIKYICLVDGKMQMEVIDEALTNYIKSWEADNGRIRLPHKK